MSRLERLVVLLETGSTRFIRDTAADQLSDLAKQHPEEILNLLSRVYPFLQNKKWETRVSAAKAFGGIVSHAPQWDPNADDDKMDTSDDIHIKEEDKEGQVSDEDKKVKKEADEDYAKIKKEEDEDLDVKKLIEDYYDGLISFDDWSLTEVLQCGRVLLGSSGKEYNSFNNSNNDNDDDTENVKRRKAAFTEKLGLDRQQIKSEDEVKAESAVKKEEPTQEQKKPQTAQQSARMRAMAKRKAKMGRSGNSRNHNPVDLSQSSVSRKLNHEDKGGSSSPENGNGNSNGNQTPNIDMTSQSDGKLVVEHKVAPVSPILQEHAKYASFVWQFQGVFEMMTKDLFNDVWEIRHGAAMGLRELVKFQASGAGRVKGKDREENDKRNNRT
ncbi:unnamed protein product [Ambrosiozyma monospora]|uniref:Unnamed protein product n=1 Tax=Ambrosiozyma monospora TaxID=43982 RepID=A0A9W7DHW4_AMBMO|nr:unnamed protein product [Ambrosiozyma monospora]